SHLHDTPADTATASVNRELNDNDNVLKLEKLKEIIRIRETLLRRQQRALRRRRAAAATQCLPDHAMVDNVRRLRKLKELLQLRQLPLHLHHRASGLQDKPGIDACRPGTDHRPASSAAVNFVHDTQLPASPLSEENINEETRGPPGLRHGM